MGQWQRPSLCMLLLSVSVSNPPFLIPQIKSCTPGWSVSRDSLMITSTWCQHRSFQELVRKEMLSLSCDPRLLVVKPLAGSRESVLLWLICFVCVLVLTDLVNAMHMLREKYSIKSHCSCAVKQNTLFNKLPTTNGVSQVCVCQWADHSQGWCHFVILHECKRSCEGCLVVVLDVENLISVHFKNDFPT